MTSDKKTLGILGGMGAFAGIRLMTLLFDRAVREGATKDGDFPSVVYYNLPLSDFDEKGMGDRETIKNELVGGILRLDGAGVSTIVIACNTVHEFLTDLLEATSTPVEDMVEAAVDHLVANGHRRIAVLSSRQTRDAFLYVDKLQAKGKEVVRADDSMQEVIDMAILSATRGEVDMGVYHEFTRVLTSLVKHACVDAILLGCTELPLVFEGEKWLGVPIYDSGKIVMDKIYEKLS